MEGVGIEEQVPLRFKNCISKYLQLKAFGSNTSEKGLICLTKEVKRNVTITTSKVAKDNMKD